MTSTDVDKLKSIQTSLKKLSRQELIELAQQVSTFESKLVTSGPRDNDELHQWVKDNLDVDIPRVPVCDNHQAPFDFFADCYFQRTNSVFVIANRGGSKTFLVAILHLVNSKFKNGCESITVGAIEAQAKRAYAHLLKLLRSNTDLLDDLVRGRPLMSETNWKNGSKVEIVAGTMNAVNGPHPQIVHFDEVELADYDVFIESRNMSASSKGVPAQDILTSTRKYATGLMQKINDEIETAVTEKKKPPYKKYQWCIFECAAPVKNCQIANPDAPNPCSCDKVIKGNWDDDTPRTFEGVCAGRLARAGGWITLEDIHKKFIANSRAVWEAQQECIKPSTEGLVLPDFSVERHGIRDWEPWIEYGPVYAGIDFGGTNPHAVLWFQYLREEIEVRTEQGGMKILKPGTLVLFDEFYRANIGNVKLADAIVAKERYWAKRFDGFSVNERFPDPQGKAARLELRDHRPSLSTRFFATRDREEHIKVVREIVEEDRLYVVTKRCPMFLAEISAWHYAPKKGDHFDLPDKPVEEFDHAMAAMRYAIIHIYYLHKKSMKRNLPGVLPHGQTIEFRSKGSPVAAGPRKYVGANVSTSWRDSIKP